MTDDKLVRISAGKRTRDGCDAVPLDWWLDDLLNERAALIMRLRHIERVLVANGRIKRLSVPKD